MNSQKETAKISEFFDEVAAYEKAGRLDLAYEMASRLAQAVPTLAPALNLAGLLAYKRAEYDLALEWLNKAMAIDDKDPAFPRNAALVYHARRQSKEAEAHTQRALELLPTDASLYFNKALMLYDQLELEAGLVAVDQALERDPTYADAQFLKAELLLISNKFAEGWESYEGRFGTELGKGMLPPTLKPQWDGKPLQPGRLLLVADQGFGDCIQFARYIPWVTQRAPAPTLAASQELVPLLRQIPGLGKVVKDWGDVGEYDVYMPLSGLPRMAGTTPETIPAPVPYLQVDPRKKAYWQARLNELLPAGVKRIGLVWAGRPTHARDKHRSINLAQFEPLLSRDDTVFVSVQKGDRIDDVGGCFFSAPMLNLGPMIHDFTDTLAILQNLDHLVSVDTSVVHLAGASGVPTSLLLPFAPDWRWMLDREDSPWYPTIRLFRQKVSGDWDEVIKRLAASL